MPLSALTLRSLRFGIGILLVGVLLVPFAAHAEGEDQAVIEKVTNLNKKALDAYNNLEFEDARKLLKQALELCGNNGLDKHPIKARTHIHMGVVLIASKQQELGIKQFKKALEIQPDIQVTKALANPEIVQAFEEASAGGGGGGSAASGGEGGDAGSGNAGSAVLPSAGAGAATEVTGDISLVPVARGQKGKPVLISATVSAALTGFAKVVLAYRAEGATEFVGTDMRRSGNKFIGEIPATATGGAVVRYYVEAEAEDETAVATNGSEEKPYAVYLTAGATGGRGGDDGNRGGGADDKDNDGPRFTVSLAGGSGAGYTTGQGELNANHKVSPGFARAAAAQVVPEVGYFLIPNFRLSVQLRLQFVTGRTPLNLKTLPASDPTNRDSCGSDQVCSTGSPLAPSIFVRGTWFFGTGMFQPYFSMAAGGGIIRHVVTFNSLEKICGLDGKQECVDSVLAGPVFVGPGGGLNINLTPVIGVLLELNTVLGFPKFTYNLDINAGVVARF